jgi:hypothetical protein
MKSIRRHLGGTLAIVALILGLGASLARAQAGPETIRVALLPQWVVNQHRVGPGLASSGTISPELQRALDAGVVGRIVFWWQRGVIQRDALVWKPVRVLDPAEAAPLGGRGTFELVAVRPPAGASAWTEVEVAPRSGQPTDVAIVEIGGELAPLRQVLDSLAVVTPGGALAELSLAQRALIRSAGVPVITAPFGRPVAEAPGLFEGTGGVGFLVVRSQIETVQRGDITTNGLADSSPFQAGEWREADRVFLRVPIGTLAAGVPALVMGWRDRQPRPGGGEDGDLRRSLLRSPLLR